VPPTILLLFLLLAWVGQAQQQGEQGTSADLVRPAWVVLGTWRRCRATRALPADAAAAGPAAAHATTTPLHVWA
jgi:hypothetical protein